MNTHGGWRRRALAGREPTGRAWVRSSYSGDGQECVEVAAERGRTLVRDSKCPGSGRLMSRPGGREGRTCENEPDERPRQE
ncbi:DUF397 domain-containing protein [Streptomyces sp. NPDC018057]|uniref:DUF397 domain-containing protein n=1 Tax=unclassified Streptomyces TaxID=2593676 RepID=UPI0037B29188